MPKKPPKVLDVAVETVAFTGNHLKMSGNVSLKPPYDQILTGIKSEKLLGTIKDAVEFDLLVIDDDLNEVIVEFDECIDVSDLFEGYLLNIFSLQAGSNIDHALSVAAMTVLHTEGILHLRAVPGRKVEATLKFRGKHFTARFNEKQSAKCFIIKT